LGQNTFHEISSKDEIIFFSPTLSSIKPKRANKKGPAGGRKRPNLIEDKYFLGPLQEFDLWRIGLKEGRLCSG
jgi:hypothetical protein